MLLEALKANESFRRLPIEKQEIFARLASVFEDNELALYLSPQELTSKLQIGNKNQWQEFLNMEIVRQYIKGQMAQMAQIATRRTFKALKEQGESGNVQAIKQINELSGVLNSGDDNRVVVLHRVERPKEVFIHDTTNEATDSQSDPV